MTKVKFGPIYTRIEDIMGPVELAEKAESWGYDSFWVPDYVLQAPPRRPHRPSAPLHSAPPPSNSAPLSWSFLQGSSSTLKVGPVSGCAFQREAPLGRRHRRQPEGV